PHPSRVAALTGRIIRSHAVIISRALAQAGHNPPSRIAHVQVVVTVHVVAKRVARRDVQSVANRAAYALPVRHKAAACRRRRHLRRANFSLGWNLPPVLQIERTLWVGPRHVRAHTPLEYRQCAPTRTLPWHTWI